ncbi:DUF4386 domain-containing protein [Paenibacillus chartarius]|uniref:DUF4386 domain-containing protein n=1 Tax=Paenibacillus chartarius TaxID=747481 RepID=A0ABV6DG96_9BACL
MTANRGTARLAGALFLISTAAFLIGSGLIDSVLNQPEYLARLYPDRMKVMLGLFLELINCAAVVGIAMLMYPVLKRHRESIALGYFGSRLIESALLLISILGTLALLAISEEYIAAGGNGDAYFVTIGKLAVRGQHMAFELAMLVLSLGSVLFCSLLYRTKLIPRAMSILGMIGYFALMASSCLTMMGYEPGSVLFIPGGIFELIFPVWLILKGFERAE